MCYLKKEQIGDAPLTFTFIIFPLVDMFHSDWYRPGLDFLLPAV